MPMTRGVTCRRNRKMVAGAILAVFYLFAVHPVSSYAQGFANFSKGHGKVVLKVLQGELEKNYYDPSIRGAALDEHFKKAEAKIDAAASTGQVFGIIAQALIEMDDSHTFFVPPERANEIEYGWQMQAIGDQCFIIAVKPGSDAELKGMKVGDQVVTLDGFAPTRELMWQIHYAYYSVRPVPVVHLELQSPDGQQRELDVAAKTTQGKRVFDLRSDDIWKLIRDSESKSRIHRHRFHEVKEELLIWKMPQFDLNAQEVDRYMDRARKFKALIIDMRSNGGGAVSTLERLAGFFVEQDTKIADLKGRKKMDPQETKTRGDDIFKGKLIMLVDSASGSASEVFSRFTQLQNRGTVLGDQSAGAVMQSRYHPFQLGTDTVFFYGASITNADVIMGDGESLEKRGVAPDELLLPGAEDLAKSHDPVLARAASLAGVEMSAEEAGKLFPIEWR
ncbi:MAG: hypothetical protein EXQ56_00635 [Acidobacteria bacterium]|nr:hypothetical protein [Acidobacteriota bacterium]